MAEPDLRAVAFPTLEDDCLADLGQCSLTVRRSFRDGEALFRVGDRDPKCFVVLSGAIEIVDESGSAPKRVTKHGRGQFSGDVSQITGRPAIVSGYARGQTDVYALTQASLREILNAHPDLADIILKAFIARRHMLRSSGEFTGLRILGPHSSAETFRVRDFLSRNNVLFKWEDTETETQYADLLKQFGLTAADTVVLFAQQVLLRNPTNRQLADRLGLRRPLDSTVYDLAVVGAGPAGLAAAVYAASEGLSTVVLEQTAHGGQAGRSMRIENYLGFPMGITGGELADRAVLQASKFGAALPVASQVVRLCLKSGGPILHLDGGETVAARCVLIATGADYRLLGVEGCERYEGRGVYYAAGPIEAKGCAGTEVVIVGGGNSAGQAAVFLSGYASKVFLVIRGDNLSKSMSDYLVRRVKLTANIEILCLTQVRRLVGDGALEAAELLNMKTGEVRTIRCPGLFSFIGAVPRTDWLPAEIERDAKQFVLTGSAVAQSPHWPGKRHPFFLETSYPGVFAAGDVRSDSVKRVASAVGEGSMAVQFVHEHLKAG